MGQLSERLLISGLSVLPKNAVSRAVGTLAHLKLPRLLSSSSVRAFVRLYNINVNEAESSIDSYGSIGELLRDDSRWEVVSLIIDRGI